MKYIVTGGAGFIGSNIVDYLLKFEHEVIVIDNESSDANEQFYWNNKAKNYKYDICEYEKIFPLFEGVDVVLHLAAEARIQPCIINPQKAIETNIKGTFNVLEASRHNKVKRVVYSSTSSAYGLKNKPPLDEEMPKDCLNPYSVTKTCGEELCLMYQKLYGLETVIFRYFNVYGPRQPLKGQYAPVIGIFLKQKRNNEPLTIVGDGLQRRDFTHVSDVVSANIKAAITDVDQEAYGQVYNVGTGTNYSVNQIARMISENKVNIAPRPGETRYSLANNQKLRKTFGWEPTVKLEDWIAKNA